jgi:Rrf2 family protein
MKIAAKDEYACSAVLELALNYGNDAPVRVQDIAQRQGIPLKFLFQIMQILKRLDIVRSKRGTEGGYVLARHPRDITVGDVIRSVSGPFLEVSADPNGAEPSQFKPIWAEVDRAIAGVLNAVTFDDLARKARENKRQMMYHI